MSTYAQIDPITGLVFQIARDGKDVRGPWIKIDGINPQPGIGWSFDGRFFLQPITPVLTTQAEKLAQILITKGVLQPGDLGDIGADEKIG